MKIPERRWTGLIVVAVGCLVLDAAAQQVTQGPPLEPRQQPALTFRAATNLVEVDAIVTDASGAFVRGLQREDFEIHEDGKLQHVTVSALVDIPLGRADPPLFRDRPIEPDVVNNEKPFDGRVFMIVLDGFHVAGLRSASVRTHARRFVERFLGANDLAAVIHIGQPGAGQEFTSNPRLLLESIDKFSGIALSSATANIVRDAKLKNDLASAGFDPGPPEDTEARERAFMARETSDALQRMAQYMTGLAGRRKAVLLFSEGIDYDTIEKPVEISAAVSAPVIIGEAGAVRTSQREMIAAATRSNVAIYSIDPRGLTTGIEEVLSIGTLPAPRTDDPTIRNYGITSIQADLMSELRLAQESLRQFSSETGGLSFLGQNDMDAAFQRVLDDNSAYYLLGYPTPDPRRNGRFHRVTVSVKRPGLRVRTRNGYYAPADKVDKAPADPVRDVLASPAPLTGLGMRASAGVMRTPDGRGRVHLTVEFNGKDIEFKSQAGLFVNDIEVGYYALDMTGKPQVSARQFVHVRLLPASRQAFPNTGMRYVTEFEIAPGRYQLRLAARDPLSGRTGSIFHDFDVPDYARLPLAMSDLLITSSGASRMMTGKGAPSLGPKLPGQTTTTREFGSGETLSFFAGVYDSNTDRTHNVDFTVTITSDDGSKVFTREDARSTEEIDGQTGTFPYTVTIPLRTLTRGRYVLSVEARSRLGGDAVRRDVEFRIR